MPKFQIDSTFKPTGDQPQAIQKLVSGLNSGKEHQVLLGVTGSGKTFTMANVIQAVQKPTQVIYPAKHYITPEQRLKPALKQIEIDLEKRLVELKSKGKLVEAQRLEQRTNYDLEMIKQFGFCNGIENYSRYFDGRAPGDPPYTLMHYFPKDYLIIIDESHMSLPQIRGMYNGDRSRKETLIDFG